MLLNNTVACGGYRGCRRLHTSMVKMGAEEGEIIHTYLGYQKESN